MAFSVVNFLTKFGALRLALSSTAVMLMVFRPSIGSEVIYSGWEVLTTLIVPVLVPIVFMLLMLDAIMAGIIMSGHQGDERKRYKTFIKINLGLGLVLVLYWIPYFSAILS